MGINKSHFCAIGDRDDTRVFKFVLFKIELAFWIKQSDLSSDAPVLLTLYMHWINKIKPFSQKFSSNL